MSEGRQRPRRQAREAALQVLFAAEAGSGLALEGVEAAFDAVLGEFSLPPRALQRARELVRGVSANLKAIDEIVGLRATNWQLERLARVDRNVLRVATFELVFESGTPPEVVIDEAIEVARRFGADESASFVNGVLDAIARERNVVGP